MTLFSVGCVLRQPWGSGSMPMARSSTNHTLQRRCGGLWHTLWAPAKPMTCSSSQQSSSWMLGEAAIIKRQQGVLVIAGLLSLIISSGYWIGRGANDWLQKGMHCERRARGGGGGGGGGGGRRRERQERERRWQFFNLLAKNGKQRSLLCFVQKPFPLRKQTDFSVTVYHTGSIARVPDSPQRP